MKRIIHIEDVDIVYKQVKEGVSDHFGDENVTMENLDYESAATDLIQSGEASDIVLMIVDLMIAYHHDDSVEIPREVLEAGSFDAGFRLIRKMRAAPVWRKVPIVVYSSVESNIVEQRLKEESLGDIPVCQKTYTLQPLLSVIEAKTGLRRIQR